MPIEIVYENTCSVGEQETNILGNNSKYVNNILTIPDYEEYYLSHKSYCAFRKLKFT